MTLAGRPDLFEAVYAIPYPPGSPQFMEGSLTSLLARFPARGWDEVVVWAAEDALDAVAPDTACGLEIAVDPSCRGRGLSSAVLAAMREAVAAAGLLSLVIPVRPPDKDPGVSMAEYASAVRSDGLPVDRWLRTHVRAGGVIECVAPCSATVQGSLADWRRWTGLPFDRDGLVVVPGALAPIFVSTVDDYAVYVEANVWVSHGVTGVPTRSSDELVFDGR
ncbi:hypothetical protein [Amycolatopsis sp. NPDC003861]